MTVGPPSSYSLSSYINEKRAYPLNPRFFLSPQPLNNQSPVTSLQSPVSSSPTSQLPVAPYHFRQCPPNLSTSTAHVCRVPSSASRHPPSNEADRSLQRRAPRPPTFLSRQLPRTRSLSSPTRSTPSPSELLPFLPAFPPASHFLSLGGPRLRGKRLYGQLRLLRHSPSTRRRSSHRPTSSRRRRNASQSTSPRSRRAPRAKRRPARAAPAVWPNSKLRNCARKRQAPRSRPAMRRSFDSRALRRLRAR